MEEDDPKPNPSKQAPSDPPQSPSTGSGQARRVRGDQPCSHLQDCTIQFGFYDPTPRIESEQLNFRSTMYAVREYSQSSDDEFEE